MKKKIFPYPNTLIFLVIIISLIGFADSPAVISAINFFSSLGHFGVVFAGIFFVSSFTVAPATFLLVKLSSIYGALEIAVLGGLGAVIGDYIIFKFFRDGLFDEISYFFKKYRISGFTKSDTKFFKSYIQPILGALIIASPFPDEVGVAMLGLSNIKKWQFVIIAFTLNAIGIGLLVTLL